MIRIAHTKYTDLPAPRNDGVWGTGRRLQMCGPDHLGQLWNVAAGQAICTSTVQMCPGSLDVRHRRRTCPSTLVVPVIIVPLSEAGFSLFAMPSPSPVLRLPCLRDYHQTGALCLLRVCFAHPLQSDPVPSPSMSLASTMLSETCVCSTFRSHPLGLESVGMAVLAVTPKRNRVTPAVRGESRP